MGAFSFVSSSSLKGRAPFCFSNSIGSVYVYLGSNTALGIVNHGCFAFPGLLVRCLGREGVASVL